MTFIHETICYEVDAACYCQISEVLTTHLLDSNLIYDFEDGIPKFFLEEVLCDPFN